MTLQTERKLQVNRWIVVGRWFYIIGVFLAGIVGKTADWYETNLPIYWIILVLSIYGIVNYVFYYSIGMLEGNSRLKDQDLDRGLGIIGFFQIMLDLIVLTVIMNLFSGIEGIGFLFFILPVINSSFLFGIKGTFITALYSAILVNVLVILEKYGFIQHIQKFRFMTEDYQDFSVSLTKTLGISLFYFIIAMLTGLGSKLLYQREKQLKTQAEKLQRLTLLKEYQYKKLRKTTDLLSVKEKDLSKANQELDVKIKDLQKAKSTLLVANREIVREKEKISAIVSNFVDPIIVLDVNNRIILFNEVAEKILGVTEKAKKKPIDPKNNYAIMNFQGIFKCNIDSARRIERNNSKSIFVEEVAISKDDKKFTFKVITGKITNVDGTCLGAMKLFYDITREKNLDRMKSEFISIAAHQLRTPLAAIKWTTEMVLDETAGKLTQEQKNLLAKSYASNEHLISIVNDLLNVSRIEEGTFGYSFAQCDFAQVVRDALSNLRRIIAKNKVKMKTRIPKKIPLLFIDQEKIQLVLQNILDNAIKYSPEMAEIKLTVKNNHKEKTVEVIVADHGIGIPLEEQPNLFSKFFRASNAVKTGQEGTGFGLFVVKKIILRHGGNIKVESQPSKGTTVSFSIPVGREKVLRLKAIE